MDAMQKMTDFVVRTSLLFGIVAALIGWVFFDGKVARRFDMITDWGKILDPIADKLTQGVVVISLIFRF